MGVILDSSALIRAERRGQTEVQILREVGELTGGDDLGLSAVCVTEFLHGIYRAKDASRRGRREMFFEQLLADIPVYEFTLSAARLAGRIGGEQAELGVPNSIFGSVSDLPLWNSTLLF